MLRRAFSANISQHFVINWLEKLVFLYIQYRNTHANLVIACWFFVHLWRNLFRSTWTPIYLYFARFLVFIFIFVSLNCYVATIAVSITVENRRKNKYTFISACCGLQSKIKRRKILIILRDREKASGHINIEWR